MAMLGATLRPTKQSSDLFATFDFLQKAIKYGDVEKSKEIVAILAKQKANVQVQEKEEENLVTSDDFIGVKVYIEDKDLAGTNMNMKLRPSMKIRELKTMMLQKHGFPPEIQKWIIGKKIVKDEDSLRKLRIKSGSSVYLYLLSPQSVGLSKEAYSQKYGTAIPYENEPLQNVIQPTPARQNQQPQAEALQEFAEDDYLVPVQNPAPQLTPKQPVPSEPQILSYADVGWTCPQCTYKNEPTRPGCEMCSGDRPANYEVPQGIKYQMTEKEKRRLQRERDAERLAEEREREQEVVNARHRSENYDHLLATWQQGVIKNDEEFDCPVCFDTIEPGDGIRLQECLHQFCRLCAEAHIVASTDPQVKCPHQDDQYSCPAMMLEREVRELAPHDVYEKYLERGLAQAESQAANSYHCKTVDCKGWCLYDDNANFFDCIVCGKKNCLTCKAIHEGQNCKQYQDDIRIKAQNDVDAKKTQEALEDIQSLCIKSHTKITSDNGNYNGKQDKSQMLKSGDAMECPQCRVVITKKLGCDWLKCTMCKTEICWVTKGRRWGPNGVGDTSGGCKCNVNRVRCHPQCQNCH